MAKTNKMWIKAPKEKKKYPNNHPIINITTISQIKSLIIFGF